MGLPSSVSIKIFWRCLWKMSTLSLSQFPPTRLWFCRSGLAQEPIFLPNYHQRPWQGKAEDGSLVSRWLQRSLQALKFQFYSSAEGVQPLKWKACNLSCSMLSRLPKSTFQVPGQFLKIRYVETIRVHFTNVFPQHSLSPLRSILLGLELKLLISKCSICYWNLLPT